MKDKNQLIKGLFIAAGTILVCVLCFFASEAANSKINDNSSSSNVEDITTQAQRESDAVKDDEKKDFNDINVDQFIDIYSGSEKQLVLLSRPTCGYCQIAEPILQNIAYKYDLVINHLNTDNFSSDDGNKLVETNDRFEEFGTPLLLVVSNNEIVDEVSGLTTTEIYTEFFKTYEFIN